VAKPGRAPSARELTRRLASLESSLKTHESSLKTHESSLKTHAAVDAADIELELELDQPSTATRAEQVCVATRRRSSHQLKTGRERRGWGWKALCRGAQHTCTGHTPSGAPECVSLPRHCRCLRCA
jgi:hypothetical protein